MWVLGPVQHVPPCTGPGAVCQVQVGSMQMGREQVGPVQVVVNPGNLDTRNFWLQYRFKQNLLMGVVQINKPVKRFRKML